MSALSSRQHHSFRCVKPRAGGEGDGVGNRCAVTLQSVNEARSAADVAAFCNEFNICYLQCRPLAFSTTC